MLVCCSNLRAMTAMDAPGPPGEKCRGPDQIAPVAQCDDPRGLDIFQFVDRGEMPVHESGVGERPQMLDRLQFWRVGREEEQMDMLGHAQSQAVVPPGPVQNQDNLFVGTSAHLCSERFELRFKQRNAHAGREMADRAARGWVHKTDEVAPREAVLDGSERTLVTKRPHVMQNRLEADAVFIDGPQFYHAVWERGCHLLQQWT